MRNGVPGKPDFSAANSFQLSPARGGVEITVRHEGKTLARREFLGAGTTSEFSNALQVTTDDCPTLTPLVTSATTTGNATTFDALAKMGAYARSEVAQSKAAFAGRDVELAEDLVRQDREINRLNRQIFRTAIEIGDDVDTREWAMHMILVARALERIGDNAVDIGEQVAFVVTGLFREFSDSSHPTGVRPDAAPDGGSAAY